MGKTSQVINKIFRISYKIFPFFVGIYSYYPAFIEQERPFPFLDTIYSSLRLYSGFVEDGVPVDILLQIARFMGMAAAVSLLISAANKINDVINWAKLFNPNSTVVYGDSSYAEYMLKSLKPSLKIHGTEDKPIENASRYLLMFSSDAENLAFYHRNYEIIKDKNVYIMLDGVSRQNIENPSITVFSIAENCARQYWKDYPAVKSERIAVIGFGNVGKNILLYGLQINLIDPAQHFEYHIYGDGSEFRREHTELDKMEPDSIVFHDDGIYKFAELAEFDRVIICGDENQNITAASKLLVAAPVGGAIYIYAPNGDVITDLFGRDRLICFGTAEEMVSADIIFNEKSMEAARAQHEFYFKKYGGAPWEKLDAFKRYSNVSSSDYLHTIKRLMGQGVPMETIAELEHIRWCRYYYIHNWKYGLETDTAKRIHNCLIPFAQLSEAEKLKDIEAIKSKMNDDFSLENPGIRQNV